MSQEPKGAAREHEYADYLRGIVVGLVESPQEVQIEKSLDEQGVLLSISVTGPDMGKVIGKQGTTAAAIRTLLRAYGMKMGARISMKILEPGEAGV
jgi:predicted RNA-binding protein YlqC (UPF0109 family)